MMKKLLLSALLTALVAGCAAESVESADASEQALAMPAPPTGPGGGGAACQSFPRPTSHETSEKLAVEAAEKARAAADEAYKLADEAYKLALRRSTEAGSSAIARSALEEASQAAGRARSTLMQREAELVAKRASLKAVTELYDNLAAKCCSGLKFLTCLPMAVAIEMVSNPSTCQAAEIERRPSCEDLAQKMLDLQAQLDQALTENAQNINAMNANSMACASGNRTPDVCAALADQYRLRDEEMRALIPQLKAAVTLAQAELNLCATCKVVDDARAAAR